MSLPSHGQRILYVIIKLPLICNGIEKWTNIPIIINPHLYLSSSSFSSYLQKSIFFVMLLLGDSGTTNMFRHKLSGFSGKRRSKSQIGDSCGNFEFVTATGGQPPFKFRIYLLNTNIRKCTGFGEYLCHRPLQNINHRGSEHLNWRAWWMVWSLFISFGRSGDL